jgi:hypothetical protein
VTRKSLSRSSDPQVNRNAAGDVPTLIVPDCGTGERGGLAGTMTIAIVAGEHSYDFCCTLPDLATQPWQRKSGPMKRQSLALAALVAILLALPLVSAQEKTKDPLAKSLQDADAIFTATIGKVDPKGQTNSIPPSTFGSVTFKDAKPLLGAVPANATFSYSFREGTTKNLDLEAKGMVLVATKQKGVSVIVPATAANLAFAQQTIDGAKKK